MRSFILGWGALALAALSLGCRRGEAPSTHVANWGNCSTIAKQAFPGRHINDIQQKRNPDTSQLIPFKRLNDVANPLSRPVPRQWRMTHHFYVGNSPITGYPHEGLDYSAVDGQQPPEGEPVHAIFPGVVVFVLSSCSENGSDPMCGDGWGNHVLIEHGSTDDDSSGVYSRYAHLQPGSLKVRPGDAVAVGTHIADIGMSGYTAGPHLHLEMGIARKVEACKPSMLDLVFNPWNYMKTVDGNEPLQGAAPARAGTHDRVTRMEKRGGELGCPSGSEQKTLASGGRYCASATEIHGPFTAVMKEKCKQNTHNDPSCDGEKWGLDFGLWIRGQGLCPEGASFDEGTGYCVEGKSAFGPFPKNIVEACARFSADASVCRSGRYDRGFLKGLLDGASR